MKTLNEYLSTKVKVSVSDSFTEYQTKKSVCEFLESKGFEKVSFNGLADFYGKFNKSDKPIYACGEFNQYNGFDSWVRFGNGGKMNASNPVFFWRIIPMRNQSNYQVSNYPGEGIHTFETFKEFKQYTTKFFNW